MRPPAFYNKTPAGGLLGLDRGGGRVVQAQEKDKLERIGHTSERQSREYQDVRHDDLRRITDIM